MGFTITVYVAFLGNAFLGVYSTREKAKKRIEEVGLYKDEFGYVEEAIVE